MTKENIELHITHNGFGIAVFIDGVNKNVLELSLEQMLHIGAILLNTSKKFIKLAWLEKQSEPIDKIVKRAMTEKQRVLLTETNGDANIDWDTRSLQDVKLLLEHGLDYIKKLEKQGEQKSTSNQFTPEQAGVLDKHIDKFLEQKSADKLEPKFNEGKWITNGDYTWKIVEVKPLDYILQSQDGNIVDDTISHVDEQFHSFTIQDAKAGDVLVCKGNIKNSNGIKYERICLFNNLDNAFFTLTKTSNFVEEYDIDVNIDYPDNTVPATKEQKEILFMAMKGAGYEWDAEKKELKKVEQKTADWSEKDETNLNEALSYIKNNVLKKFIKSLRPKYMSNLNNFKL